jgi:hypothetical protein
MRIITMQLSRSLNWHLYFLTTANYQLLTRHAKFLWVNEYVSSIIRHHRVRCFTGFRLIVDLEPLIDFGKRYTKSENSK